MHMSAGSLDSLILSSADLDRYNGHHSLHTIEFPRPANDISKVLIDLQASPHNVAQWLGQPKPKTDDQDASMKMLIVQTRNQSTAKRVPGLAPLPVAFSRESSRPRTPERQRDVEFVKDIFTELGLPLAAFGAYIKAHITFVCVPGTPQSPEINTLTSSNSCTKYYCSGTSWTVAWSHNPTLRHTAAVMFHREGDGDTRKDEVLADILRL